MDVITKTFKTRDSKGNDQIVLTTELKVKDQFITLNEKIVTGKDLEVC